VNPPQRIRWTGAEPWLPALVRAPALAAILAVSQAALLSGCASGPRAPPAAPSTPSAPKAPAPDASPAARQTDAERQAEFDRSMVRWHGAKLRELLGKLGAPDSRTRLRSGEWQYTYVRATMLRGPAGPQRFSCVVSYRVDARREFIVGHRIQGC
jgi:hypothetical protein